MTLALCPSCHRHVAVRDSKCPFCGQDRPVRRASGAVPTVVLAVGLGAAAGGCFSSSDGGDPAPAYGPAPYDAATDSPADVATADVRADADDGGMLALYGPAPSDAASDANGDDGGNLAAYGPAPAYGPALSDAG